MVSQRHSTRKGRVARSPRPAPDRLPLPPVAVPAPGRLDDPVLQAAYDAVMDLGLRRTTVSEVARRAGVSRMTVYRRHDDLSRLIAELLTVELGRIVTAVESALTELPDARSRLVATTALVTRAVAAHPLLNRVLELDPVELQPLVTDRLGSTQRLALTHLVAGIAAGQPGAGGDGSIRDGDPGRLALTLLVALQSFVFSARVVVATDARVFDELPLLVDRYLAPDTLG